MQCICPSYRLPATHPKHIAFPNQAHLFSSLSSCEENWGPNDGRKRKTQSGTVALCFEPNLGELLVDSKEIQTGLT
jgi:hypothetical protein